MGGYFTPYFIIRAPYFCCIKGSKFLLYNRVIEIQNFTFINLMWTQFQLLKNAFEPPIDLCCH